MALKTASVQLVVTPRGGTDVAPVVNPAVRTLLDVHEAEPRSWRVRVQVGDQSDGTVAIECTIKEVTGDATFVRTIPLTPGPILPLHIYAAGFRLSLSWGAAAGSTADVSAMASDADSGDSLTDLFPRWVLDAAVGIGDTPVIGSGWLLGASGSCDNMGGLTALWLFVCDPSELPVSGLNVGAGGTGFTTVPELQLSNPSGQATAATGHAVMGSSTSVTVTAGGTGYTTATVAASAPQLAGGVQATYSATVSGGGVTAVTCTNQGSGYDAPPTLSISGDGSGATASTTLSIVQAVLDTNGGGYIQAPSVTVVGGGGSGASVTATANAATAGTVQGLAPPVQIGQTGQFGFSDEVRVAVGYSTGLTWVLSSSQAGVNTNGLGAASARCDLKVAA